MTFVEEIVVGEFLPTYRSMLASALHDRGNTQREIAELLDISQSAVSKHIHGEITRNERIEENEQVRDLVERMAAGLTTGELEPVDAVLEAEACIRDLERGGVLADLHADRVAGLEPVDAAAIHDTGGRLQESARVRASVRRGLRILENTPGFAQQIPAVGSNLVESLSTAESIEDVVAVPGRILGVRGRVTVPGEPEFGVSQHVAGVLLAARAAGSSEIRAAANIRYNEDIRNTLEDQGHTAVEFDAEVPIDEAISDAIATATDATVLYQTGGFGVEPVLYLLGPDAPTVARTLRETFVEDG